MSFKLLIQSTEVTGNPSKWTLQINMRILDLFLFVFLMLMAFFSPAAAQRRPVPNSDPRHHSNKHPDYHRHIFKKRDAADFEEYVDEAI